MIKYILSDQRVPIGHYCPSCNKEFKWPFYVFAHYKDVIIHSCENAGCEQKIEIQFGEAKIITKPVPNFLGESI